MSARSILTHFQKEIWCLINLQTFTRTFTSSMLTTSFANCWKNKTKYFFWRRPIKKIVKFLTFIAMVSSPFSSFIANTFKRFILTMSILASWQGNTRIALNSFPANFAGTNIWRNTFSMEASLIVSKITNGYGTKCFDFGPPLMTYYLTRIITSVCFTFL